MKAASVLSRALVFGAVATVAVAVVGALVGVLVAGIPGLVSALLGAGLTALFMGVTTVSILLAQRVTRTKASGGIYFGIILGMWVLKFAVFIAVLIAVRGQDWMNPYIFFFAVIAAVVVSLVTDVVALSGAQVSAVLVDGVEAPADGHSTGRDLLG